MKTLKFVANLVPLIIAGEKTTTWRLFDDKDLQPNDELSFVNKITGVEFATAKIISITEKTLGEITNADFKGHEKFRDKQEMLETYQKFYGGKVDWDTSVKMIDFKVLKINI